jgi:cytochrome c biogenesis protein
MTALRRLAALLSDLRLAIGLLLLIALASAIGTILPQGEAPELYAERFNATPWLGLINGDRLLALQLDRV